MSASTLSHRKERMIGLLTPLLTRIVRRESFSVPGALSNSARILVVDSGDLTELLFFAPVLAHLKYRFPGMRVTMLVREGNSELLRTMDQISEMITYEPSHLSPTSATYFSLLRRMKSRKFDVTFLLGRQFSFARSLIAFMTRAPLRVGFTRQFTYPFLNCEIRYSNDNQYEAPRAIGFLNALGISPGEALPGWKLPKQDARWASQMIHFRKPEKDTRLIAVDPGIGKARHRLVDKSFAMMVNQICERYPSRVLILSNNLDKRGLARFKSMLNVDIIDLEPKNVKEALALLSRADLLLSGNTDFFHFSVSMRLPTLGFFTRFDGQNWYPKGTPWVQIIQGVKGQRLSLEEVYSKIDTLLQMNKN